MLTHLGSADRPLLAGVVHLLPLPGAPRPCPGLDVVLARAREDAQILAEAGFDLVVVENLGDAPYTGQAVAPWTIAVMTRIALAIREDQPDLGLGINVLRNDARAALGIATAVEADLIRVNVHIGTMATDQGLIEGRARDTLLARRQLGAPVAIAADVLVKHALPLGPADLAQVAKDTARRGQAEVLLVTGSGTGEPTSARDVRTVKGAVPEVPVWVASGCTPATLGDYPADGFIVGSWLHHDGRLDAPLDPTRVAEVRRAV